ncbi:hypothetical protein PCASD_03970 [Puccinia coronata f. sp. avenae]|uniref:NADH-ubiquinone oxidoreductase 9.5 kDa subunit n=1 Tax=Puccinia coronata f. sp. avenae TaxID=200324 RepID=A0A2N5VAM5_9BASI|nr:hypothetical protein PCASD_03970 [Puccinia coronata f. sp. avenae]
MSHQRRPVRYKYNSSLRNAGTRHNKNSPAQITSDRTSTLQFTHVFCQCDPTEPVPEIQAVHAHENPAIFWSVAIGAAGPVLLATVPPIRRNYFGYVSPDPIPMSYPLPQRKRNTELKGYDD